MIYNKYENEQNVILADLFCFANDTRGLEYRVLILKQMHFLKCY